MSMRTPPTERDRLREGVSVLLFAEEFFLPEADKRRIGGMLAEVWDKPDEFWKLAGEIRRGIADGSIQERRSAA